MTTDFAGDPDVFPALITAPSDGESRAAVSVQIPLEQLADRTAAIGRNIGILSAKNWTLSPRISVPNASRIVTAIAGNPGGNGRWYAVGLDSGLGSATLLFTSRADGIWATSSLAGGAFDARGITFDVVNDEMIVCGDGGTIRTSTAAAGAFTNRATGGAFDLLAVHANSGVTVAAGKHDGADIFAVRSTDGQTYSAISIPGSAGDHVNKIASSGSTWVAVGQASGGGPLIWQSVDSGVTWLPAAIPVGITDELIHLTWNGKVFTAMGDNGQIGVAPDGATWSDYAGPASGGGSARGMAADYINNIILVIPISVGIGFPMSLDGGITWTNLPHSPHPQALNSPMEAITFDGTCFAMAGNDSASSLDFIYGAQSMVL